MQFDFHKYHGAGNDFIVMDDRAQLFPSQDKALIAKLCDRRFGIGSDGILLIQNSEEADLHIDFLNPDGSRSFCGNGSRCGLRFAAHVGMIGSDCTFMASDGMHEGRLENELVHIAMRDVEGVEQNEFGTELYTGSPHLIRFVDDLDQVDVKMEGAAIRYNELYQKEGINVNFVSQMAPGTLAIRTYERGVEGETLACGTGVTAAALAKASQERIEREKFFVKAKGGVLSVRFEKVGNGFKNIWLTGPAVKVYEGSVNL
jgi:diaminopimelate epimerase